MVTFKLRENVGLGLSVRLVGNNPKLGSWDLAAAPRMYYNNGEWSCDIELPLGRMYAYKYVVVRSDSGALVRWQQGHDSLVSVYSHDTQITVRACAYGAV